MKNYVKVEGSPSLVRDKDSYAILNTDSVEIQKAKLRKQKKNEQKAEMDGLKKDVDDIKNMLSQIVEKLNGA